MQLVEERVDEGRGPRPLRLLRNQQVLYLTYEWSIPLFHLNVK